MEAKLMTITNTPNLRWVYVSLKVKYLDQTSSAYQGEILGPLKKFKRKEKLMTDLPWPPPVAERDGSEGMLWLSVLRR